MSLAKKVLTHRFPDRRREVHRLLYALHQSEMPAEAINKFACDNTIVTNSFWSEFSAVANDGKRTVLFIRQLAYVRNILPVKEPDAVRPKNTTPPSFRGFLTRLLPTKALDLAGRWLF